MGSQRELHICNVNCPARPKFTWNNICSLLARSILGPLSVYFFFPFISFGFGTLLAKVCGLTAVWHPVLRDGIVDFQVSFFSTRWSRHDIFPRTFYFGKLMGRAWNSRACSTFSVYSLYCMSPVQNEQNKWLLCSLFSCCGKLDSFFYYILPWATWGNHPRMGWVLSRYSFNL